MSLTPKSKPRCFLYPIGGLIIVFWLITMTVLVKKEFLPRLINTSRFSGYESILSSMPLHRDEWMTVYFQGTRVGYTHTSIYPRKNRGEDGYVIANQSSLMLNLLGANTEITTRGYAFISSDFQIKNFEMSLDSGKYKMKFSGRLIGSNLLVEIDSGHTKSTRTIKLEKDVIIAHDLTPFLVLGKLKPGSRQTVNLFDPITLTINPALIEVIGKATIDYENNPEEVLVVHMTYQELEVKAWVTPDGRILRQETSLGWIMIKEPREKILRLTSDTKGLDILKAVSVDPQTNIETPRKIKYLKIKIQNIDTDQFNNAGSRQKIIDADNKIAEVISEIIKTENIQTLPVTKDKQGRDLSPYLESTIFIQSDNKEISSRARKIIKDETNAWQAAQKISDWVYGSVKKVPTFSIPSSIDVLNNREGDCNEHTYLFTALARSVGIPTRVAIGLVALDNRFYYHAWPFVYVGQWIHMDPTLNQPIADATHLKLLEGEIADQIKLTGLIGKIKIKIIEYE